MKYIFKYNLHILAVYMLLVFPMFYFVYKFGVLLAGYEDAKSYFKLFEGLNPKEIPAPFNMRLLSSFIVHLVHQTGLFYNTECAIDAFPAVDKTYFFSNVLYNFVCIVLICFSLFKVFCNLGFSQLLSFLMGVLFLLGFGTVFYTMMPGVDALSILFFTWMLYFYLKRSYGILPFLVLLIFQREYYFLVFMLMAPVDYFRNNKHPYFIYVFVASAVCWIVYFLLRKYVFLTPHWHYQTSGSFLLSALIDIKQDMVTMMRQTFMTMNIYFLYLLVLAFKKRKGLKINTGDFYLTLALFAQITLVSIATTSGNNNGRYFYLCTPLFLYLMLKEVAPHLKIELAEKHDDV